MHLEWSVDQYMVFAYNADQMFLPNLDKKFGSHYLKVDAPKKAKFGAVYHYSQDYRISRTYWKQLDTAELRCDPMGTTSNTTKCITSYLENKIRCSMGLQGSDPEMKR